MDTEISPWWQHHVHAGYGPAQPPYLQARVCVRNFTQSKSNFVQRLHAFLLQENWSFSNKYIHVLNDAQEDGNIRLWRPAISIIHSGKINSFMRWKYGTYGMLRSFCWCCLLPLPSTASETLTGDTFLIQLHTKTPKLSLQGLVGEVNDHGVTVRSRMLWWRQWRCRHKISPIWVCSRPFHFPCNRTLARSSLKPKLDQHGSHPGSGPAGQVGWLNVAVGSDCLRFLLQCW